MKQGKLLCKGQLLIPKTMVSTLEDQICERDAILDELKFNLLQAQQKMKYWEDSKRKDVNFEVGIVSTFNPTDNNLW